MNILDLPLKAIWYDMIESGEKKEEYREHNSYWAKRFYVCYDKNTDCRIYIPEKCIVVSLPLSFMMLFVFVTDIQNELCYSN